MTQTLTYGQASREAQRRALFAEVDAIAPILAATAAETERTSKIAPAAFSAIAGTNLLRMKVPAAAGGLEVPTSTQMLVLARIAETDVSSGWNTMVNSNSAGWIAAYLSDEALAEIAPDGTMPVCAGVAPPSGTARKVDGGYRVTCYPRYCSGIAQAEWLRFCVIDEETKTPVFGVVPKSETLVHESWQVVGLRGTGSDDFEMRDVFVPERRMLSRIQRQRGGALYRMTDLRWSSFEHAGIAVGIGRRALKEARKAIERKLKGDTLTPVSDVALDELARLHLRLEATISYAEHVYDRELDLLGDETNDPNVIGMEGRAVAAHLTDIGMDCAGFAFRIAGGPAMMQPSIFEQLLRDIHGAAQHVLVQRSSYAVFGKELVERGETAA